MKALGLSLVLAAGAVADEPVEAEAPREFDTVWIVFLERGDGGADLDEAALAKLQAQHQGHLRKMIVEGYSYVAGPLEVPDDEKMRGIVLYRGDLEHEEVVALASADPMVQAGRLVARAVKWWMPKGALAFPQAKKGW